MIFLWGISCPKREVERRFFLSCSYGPIIIFRWAKISLKGNTLFWDHVSIGGDPARAFLLFCHSVEGWFMQQCFIIAVTACTSFKLFLSNTQSSQFQYKKQSKDTEDVTLDVARGLPLLLLQLALDPFEEGSDPAIQKKLFTTGTKQKRAVLTPCEDVWHPFEGAPLPLPAVSP